MQNQTGNQARTYRVQIKIKEKLIMNAKWHNFSSLFVLLESTDD
jgi:hypothetical protein